MENKPAENPSPEIVKLGELIKDIPTAMITTVSTENKLHSSPLMAQEVKFDGNLWFLISKQSLKIPDIQRDSHVNVSYASPYGKYVSVTGKAELVQDSQKVSEIWCKHYESWFPMGPSDSNIQLLKIQVEKAEYWEPHSSMTSRFLDFVKIPRKGRYEKGEHGTLDLHH